MLKKVLSASLVLLQILTQTASAMEFRPIAVQPIPALPSLITSDNLKNKNLSSNVNDFLFFKLSDSFVNQPLAGQGLSVLSKGSADETLSSLAGWRLTGAYLPALTQARISATRQKLYPLVVFDDSGLLPFSVGMNDKHPEKSVLDVYHSDWSEEGQQGTRVTTNTYESNRDLKSQVKNQVGATIVSQYDYISDNIGRRTSDRKSVV